MAHSSKSADQNPTTAEKQALRAALIARFGLTDAQARQALPPGLDSNPNVSARAIEAQIVNWCRQLTRA